MYFKLGFKSTKFENGGLEFLLDSQSREIWKLAVILELFSKSLTVAKNPVKINSLTKARFEIPYPRWFVPNGAMGMSTLQEAGRSSSPAS